jgi:hypothetical protein
MNNILDPHPLAALFPELPTEELAELAREIKIKRFNKAAERTRFQNRADE